MNAVKLIVKKKFSFRKQGEALGEKDETIGNFLKDLNFLYAGFQI